jgi:hypothetical protein
MISLTATGPGDATLRFDLDGAPVRNLDLSPSFYQLGAAEVCRAIGCSVLLHCKANNHRPPDLLLSFEDPLLKRQQ